eukprot:693682-Heterocapsa_arctica.AAC.1
MPMNASARLSLTSLEMADCDVEERLGPLVLLARDRPPRAMPRKEPRSRTDYPAVAQRLVDLLDEDGAGAR